MEIGDYIEIPITAQGKVWNDISQYPEVIHYSISLTIKIEDANAKTKNWYIPQRYGWYFWMNMKLCITMIDNANDIDMRIKRKVYSTITLFIIKCGNSCCDGKVLIVSNKK